MNGPLAIVAAFVLGSIPWALLVGRWTRGIDLRRHGSGNLGATNVFRVLGPRPGVLVLALDMAKGAVGVLAAPPGWFGILAALAAVLGHVFSPWVGFRGGKGVATAGGAFLALAPAATLVVLLVWSLIFAVTRIVSLASIGAAIALPIVLWALGAPVAVRGLAIPVALLVLVRHIPNMRRLVAGREARVGLRRDDRVTRTGGEAGRP